MAGAHRAIKGNTHASLQKGIRILELLAERSPQGVSEMAGALGLELSGLSRLLQSLAEPEREEFLKGPLPRFTEHTIIDPRKLRRELDRVRRDGCAYESEEEHRGVGCIGVPVVDPDGRWVAAVSAAGPIQGTPFRLDAARLKMVRETAAEFSRRV